MATNDNREKRYKCEWVRLNNIISSSVSVLSFSWKDVLIPVRATMEQLTNLRPFVWFCQLSGFIPFQMRIDPQTNKFQRFTFTFRHPFTWWFGFLHIFSASYIYAVYRSLEAILTSYVKTQSDLIKYYFLCVTIFQVVTLVTASFSFLRCSRLGKAIELIQKVGETLKSLSNMAEPKDTVIRRSIIGVATSLVVVKLFNSFQHFFQFIFCSHHNI